MSTDPQTCGSCRFSVHIDKHFRECNGMPPTIFVMGANQNILGQPQLNVQTMSPRVAVDRRACSLYQRALDS